MSINSGSGRLAYLCNWCRSRPVRRGSSRTRSFWTRRIAASTVSSGSWPFARSTCVGTAFWCRSRRCTQPNQVSVWSLIHGVLLADERPLSEAWRRYSSRLILGFCLPTRLRFFNWSPGKALRSSWIRFCGLIQICWRSRRIQFRSVCRSQKHQIKAFEKGYSTTENKRLCYFYGDIGSQNLGTFKKKFYHWRL